MKLSDKRKAIVIKYGHLFYNSGSINNQDIIKLIERTDIDYFNNYMLAEVQGCCASQMMLIEQLITIGLLDFDVEEGCK